MSEFEFQPFVVDVDSPFPRIKRSHCFLQFYDDGNLGSLSTDYMPVVNICPLDAERYCHWIGGRLPHSVEWEIAARTFHSNEELFNKVYYENEEFRAKEWLNFCEEIKSGNSWIHDRGRSTGSGITNLLDGVSEICHRIGSGPGGHYNYVVRGGAWFHKFYKPVHEIEDEHTFIAKTELLNKRLAKPYIGFRVALDLPKNSR